MPGVLQSTGSQRVRHNLLNDNIYLLLLVIILCNFFWQNQSKSILPLHSVVWTKNVQEILVYVLINNICNSCFFSIPKNCQTIDYDESLYRQHCLHLFPFSVWLSFLKVLCFMCFVIFFVVVANSCLLNFMYEIFWRLHLSLVSSRSFGLVSKKCLLELKCRRTFKKCFHLGFGGRGYIVWIPAPQPHSVLFM